MKTALLILTICALTLVCNDNSNQNIMFGLFKKKNKIDTFWTWFAENKQIFEQIDSANRDEKLDFILTHLQPISEGLTVELSDEFKGIRDFVISPDGDREKFEIVKEIVEKAPTINGWTFTAFRQPVNEDFTLSYQDIEFTPSKMFFYPKIDGDSLDLIIYSKHIAKQDYNIVAHYGLIAMDNVLGEFDCVMKVRHYDFHDLDEEQDKTDLRPVLELKAYVDNFYSNRKKKNGL